ncbi:PDDEXK nuclease domain-containing protein [Rhodopirellula halodulae]|uniref:PDDEXK nuclease domain-containing protein n=1 Tax=Rhodopirellula halodulae TaxID=2894198 RepID=UPI001E2D2EC4|nr:PDDEXK nuclease domain-containing protein [Rhodopirellula sp. JC737]MCC9658360.1 PDDEXK nuclease domain-containing protein [Rhodopirellula sp. JC737]
MSDKQELMLIESTLLPEIRQLIDQSRQRAAVAVNAELTMLYWDVGSAISEMLGGQRAEYGREIVTQLANVLTAEYGRKWGVSTLRHCLRAVEAFPDREIVYALRTQLSWTHLRKIIFIEDPLKREFYTEMCRLEGWSTRQLNERIQSMLYERTAISKKPEKTIQSDLEILRADGKVSADLAFRDPYVLDFLGLADTYSENDLESSILAELQCFITELGTDFAFIARQKRIVIDDRDYYIDLLFFHRRLKCLVAIDLKIGEFEAGFKGQMELYLRYLEKHERVEGENLPVGLILCSGKNEEHVELLRLDEANIRVAEYMTQLPSPELLRQKLHESIERARAKALMDQEDASDA